jgi:hypothetical protein
MSTDEIFKSLGYFGFETHGIDNEFGACLPSIDLGHSSNSMYNDSIIVGRGITAQGIRSNIFFPAISVQSNSLYSFGFMT